eukprot:6199634-Pleurochrysis_carterae.AAC.1
MGDEPVIFLDIDGVICCNYNGHLEEPKLAQLKRIVEETGAKVVLSTDWRRQVVTPPSSEGCSTLPYVRLQPYLSDVLANKGFQHAYCAPFVGGTCLSVCNGVRAIEIESPPPTLLKSGTRNASCALSFNQTPQTTRCQ